MFPVASNGYRAVAHGPGSVVTADPGRPGLAMMWSPTPNDLAELIEALDLHDAVLAGHSTGDEITRYISRHGTARVAKAVLAGAIPR